METFVNIFISLLWMVFDIDPFDLSIPGEII